MVNRRKIIIVFIAALVVTTAVSADMVPVSGRDARRGQPARVCDRADPVPTSLLSSSTHYPGVADLYSWPAISLPEPSAALGRTSQPQHPAILTDGQGSLNLCLCAFLGLGLCGSGHWVKKLSLGVIPEWYHNGGPFQIGHSHAVTPNNLSLIPARCFIQPDCTMEDPLTQYHRLGTIVSLWRKSQFTPVVLAPRGPPRMS